MFNSSVMKRVASILAAMHFMLFAQIPLAHAAMIGTPEIIAEQQSFARALGRERVDDRAVLAGKGVEPRVLGVPRRFEAAARGLRLRALRLQRDAGRRYAGCRQQRAACHCFIVHRFLLHG